MSKDRRLGTGFGGLARGPAGGRRRGTGQRVPAAAAAPDSWTAGGRAAANGRRFVQLNVYEIDDNPFQPRRDFSDSEIASLAESLKEHDMLQPILVRKVGDRLPVDLRRAAVAGGDPGRLDHRARPPPRGRRSAGGRTGDRREPAAEGPEPRREGPIVQTLPGSARLLAGGPGPAAEDRPVDDRQSDAAAGTARAVLESLRRGELSAGHARALLPLGDESLQIEFCERIGRKG